MSLLRHQIAVLSFLLFTMLLQLQVIWPVESTLQQHSAIAVGSLLYLPHGAKAICAVLSGTKAIIPLFLLHFITDLFIDMTLTHAIMSGVVSVVTLMTPVVLINFLSNKPLFESLASGITKNLSLMRLVLFVATVASILNSLFAVIRYEELQIQLIAFKYFIGDLLGTLVLLALLVGLKGRLVKLAYWIEKKTSS